MQMMSLIEVVVFRVQLPVLAQQVERMDFSHEVVGSTPIDSDWINVLYLDITWLLVFLRLCSGCIVRIEEVYYDPCYV